MASHHEGLTNFVAYLQRGVWVPRIGHFDLERQTIQPLSFDSGTPVENLYQVIEAGAGRCIAAGPVISVNDVKLLPPLSARDVLAVGKNYMEHAKEFNSSGYDSSDKVDRPSHPVIFTKRATSIIAHGDDIYLHRGFTESADYEGEIGVIIGQAGYQIHENDAWNYVWGYTIINDVTARERQRDHKQFYIGKSPDTFCPMGPIAVKKEDLPDGGRFLRLQTRVNGELRQDATVQDLIFSIPCLVSTLSAGQTLQPGDIIATGTPAGVGIGRSPPVFLKVGDEVAITVTGLGTLANKVAGQSEEDYPKPQYGPGSMSNFRLTNGEKLSLGQASLSSKNKSLGYQRLGTGKEAVIFVHGLGGTKDYWLPLISTLSLPCSVSAHVYDIEGHGIAPTHPLRKITIDTLAERLLDVFDLADASVRFPATLIAHSMGCLVAIKFALAHPSLVKKLVLLGPPPLPIPKSQAEAWAYEANQVRSHGMGGITDQIISTQLSHHSQRTNPLAVVATRLSLLGQVPEGYAKACSALAQFDGSLDLEALTTDTAIITGKDDPVSPPKLAEEYALRISNSHYTVLENVGHWHVFEDAEGVAKSLRNFL